MPEEKLFLNSWSPSNLLKHQDDDLLEHAAGVLAALSPRERAQDLRDNAHYVGLIHGSRAFWRGWFEVRGQMSMVTVSVRTNPRVMVIDEPGVIEDFASFLATEGEWPLQDERARVHRDVLRKRAVGKGRLSLDGTPARVLVDTLFWDGCASVWRFDDDLIRRIKDWRPAPPGRTRGIDVTRTPGNAGRFAGGQ